MNNFKYTFVYDTINFHVQVFYDQKMILSTLYRKFEDALDFVKKLEDAKIHREVFHD